MAVSQIEEKILGRLAKQTTLHDPLLSAALYQVLGLSILLSRKLYRARRLRRLDNTRDTKSLQLYHHIIWLSREGLSLTEVYILPRCQDGGRGAECRVMAAKLRASLYHVFCLFHNHPPVGHLGGRSHTSKESPSPEEAKPDRSSTSRSPVNARTDGSRARGAQTANLRDPIPSMTSEASYVTNPYAATSAYASPPRGLPALRASSESARTPTRPPGLAPIQISPTQAAAAFLLPPLNFVPMTMEFFEVADRLASSLLSPTHALRLSISLEHAAFLWDCAKHRDSSRRLARRAIKDVYSSADGLDDDEFADASALVQALGGIVRRSSHGSAPAAAASPKQRNGRTAQRPLIDRTIAISPEARKTATTVPEQDYRYQYDPQAGVQQVPRSLLRTPERLSTVPEVESADEVASTRTPTHAALSPPVSRLSSRSQHNRPRRNSSVTSAASDKASKRRIVEQAEERIRSRQNSTTSSRSHPLEGGGGVFGSRANSRQPTPTEGYVRRSPRRRDGDGNA